MDQELFSVSHIIKLEEEKEKIKKIREKRYECCVKIYQGLADEIDRIPAIPLIAFSIGSVICDSITSAFAPV